MHGELRDLASGATPDRAVEDLAIDEVPAAPKHAAVAQELAVGVLVAAGRVLSEAQAAANDNEPDVSARPAPRIKEDFALARDSDPPRLAEIPQDGLADHLAEPRLLHHQPVRLIDGKPEEGGAEAFAPRHNPAQRHPLVRASLAHGNRRLERMRELGGAPRAEGRGRLEHCLDLEAGHTERRPGPQHVEKGHKVLHAHPRLRVGWRRV